jgi:hypothetical protein
MPHIRLLRVLYPKDSSLIVIRRSLRTLLTTWLMGRKGRRERWKGLGNWSCQCKFPAKCLSLSTIAGQFQPQWAALSLSSVSFPLRMPANPQLQGQKLDSWALPRLQSLFTQFIKPTHLLHCFWLSKSQLIKSLISHYLGPISSKHWSSSGHHLLTVE